METKHNKNSVLRLEPSTTTSNRPLVVELSAQAHENLAKLRLKSLDRQGRQPEASQIIEKLINSAAGSVPDVPYPPNKRR